MEYHARTSHDTHEPLDHERPTPPTPTPQTESFFGELARFAIIAIVIVFPIRIFIAQPFVVAGASMEPTFENGEYLIVDQLSYRLDTPERGDVVIFRYPRDPSKFFIKRVIGLPGETVAVEGTTITIFNDTDPDGRVLDESYLPAAHERSFLTVPLAADEYFVLGDNRDASSDSRTWGVLARDLIVGRAFLRLLPLSAIDVLPGAHRSDTLLTNP